MADAVEICSRSGYMEVLYGHAPLLAELGVGHVRLHGGQNGDQDFFVVAWGFCEVLPEPGHHSGSNGDAARRAWTRRRRSASLRRGRKMWSEAGEDPEKYEQANEVIHEAEAKLATVHGSKF